MQDNLHDHDKDKDKNKYKSDGKETGPLLLHRLSLIEMRSGRVTLRGCFVHSAPPSDSAASFTRKPIFGCVGSKGGATPYSARASDVTGPIDATRVRAKAASSASLTFDSSATRIT